MKHVYRLWIIVSIFLYGNLYGQTVVDPDLQQALSDTPSSLEVIVTFHGTGTPSAQQLAVLGQAGITKGVVFQSFPVVGVVASPEQVNVLASSAEVRSLYLNKPVIYYNQNGTALTGVDRLRTDPVMIQRNGGMPVSGKGIGVMINDSGVDGTHADIKLGSHLVQNVLGTTNPKAYDTMLPPVYVEGVPNTDTNSGHGTHCAGIVGGNGEKSSGKYEGAAPGASLIGYGSGAVLFILDALGGFDYAAAHQYDYGIRVISNSWGTSGTFDPNDPISVATKALYDRGVVSVFAAGNDGPVADSHNPYAQAPWVISVGAGDKYGRLADFSSRGVRDEKTTFTMDGETWVSENRPTLTAPGVDVISTRAVSPLGVIETEMDVNTMEPAHVPYYTHMSGTSMATPHVSGIVALMLDANPALSPAEVKNILQLTATNMAGMEPWEAGAGYVNAYAAVDYAFASRGYGSTLNLGRQFNSYVNITETRLPFTVDFNPVPGVSPNEITFNVAQGATAIEATAWARGTIGETGNPVNLVLVAPDGTRYTSGIYVLFVLYHDRSVAVVNPMPGVWKLRFEALRGAVALPEEISGTVSVTMPVGTTNLNDIVGHSAEASIRLAIANRLMDGRTGGFAPNSFLNRLELADYLLMGQNIRQLLPTNGSVTYTDLSTAHAILVGESSTARGAALRDRFHANKGVVLTSSSSKFGPNADVTRAQLAYSLVQCLAQQQAAEEANGKAVTVQYNGQTVQIADAGQIPSGLEGYVQVALNLNLINVRFVLEQGPLDFEPAVKAYFDPNKKVTRAAFAVYITRTHAQWQDAESLDATAARSATNANEAGTAEEIVYGLSGYPNPFTESVTITYTLEKEQMVDLAVFDAMGNKISTLVREPQKRGEHVAELRRSGLKPGLYVAKLRTGEYGKTIKLVVE